MHPKPDRRWLALWRFGSENGQKYACPLCLWYKRKMVPRTSWRILPRYRILRYDGAGGRSSCQSVSDVLESHVAIEATLADRDGGDSRGMVRDTSTHHWARRSTRVPSLVRQSSQAQRTWSFDGQRRAKTSKKPGVSGVWVLRSVLVVRDQAPAHRRHR